MANKGYPELANLAIPVTAGEGSDTETARLRKLLAILASGQNPDGTNHIQTTGAAAASLAQFWTTGTLLAAASSEASPTFLDCLNTSALYIGRAATGGAYSFRIDWSRDGVAVDFTEIYVVPDSGSLAIDRFPARYARMRVHNTDAVTAFTAHRTNVVYR